MLRKIEKNISTANYNKWLKMSFYNQPRSNLKNFCCTGSYEEQKQKTKVNEWNVNELSCKVSI